VAFHTQTRRLFNFSLVSFSKLTTLVETGIVIVDFRASICILGELPDRLEEVFLLAHGDVC
jgi:hypothetical protein